MKTLDDTTDLAAKPRRFGCALRWFLLGITSILVGCVISGISDGAFTENPVLRSLEPMAFALFIIGVLLCLLGPFFSHRAVSEKLLLSILSIVIAFGVALISSVLCWIVLGLD